MKPLIVPVWAALAILEMASLLECRAQFPMSLGPYVQNFDSLATSGTANPWVDDATLLGWYAAKTAGGPVTGYNAGTGSANTGALYSFGVAGTSNVTDRAFGSIASGTPGNFAYGLRFTNDTAAIFTNFTVTYTGEQWRNGGVAVAHTLAFAYRVSSTPITDADAANVNSWTSVTALNFVTPTVGGTATALDGNSATNRQYFDVFLPGASVAPGQEIFFRWRDVDDTGGDHGFGVDDLTILYNLGEPPAFAAPTFNVQPQSQTAVVGDTVQFTTAASGNPPPVYQWQFNGTNLIGQAGLTLTLNGVTTNQAGSYRVIATNSQGSATSQVATLTVTVPSAGVSLLTYNVKGNGATDWSTNAAQVQAIARQLQYLQPDVITFNEIPFDLRYEMTNFITAFLPGYHLAVSTGTDGSIVSAIASRHTITRSNKWLDGIDLRSFGYSNANNSLDNFTRDLFEAQIAVPGFVRPLHVFTTHLKSTSGTTYADAAAKRAAEAAAITNFFTTNLFALYPYDLYTLSGDMNDDDTNSLAIQTLISPGTGLKLTNPKNPVTGSINTYSTTTANPGSRIDFIFPSPLLYSNIKTSQVFRTDRLTPLPPNLNSNDCKVASDHLPVFMVFNNPYDKPFKLLSVTRTNPTVTLKWESVFGQSYRVETSTNLATWTTQANQLLAIGTNHTYSTNMNDGGRFFRVSRLP
jgi:endonuclease/exonuclease/phosphatase family metal-dependent hydrolase